MVALIIVYWAKKRIKNVYQEYLNKKVTHSRKQNPKVNQIDDFIFTIQFYVILIFI